jgi:O-Antigen ligase
MNNNHSFYKNILFFLAALIFILPTYLSVSGVTLINIFLFSVIIFVSGEINYKVKLKEIIIPFFLIFIYINFYLLNNVDSNGLYKTTMINLIFLLSILISICNIDIRYFLKYTAIIISLCGFVVLIISLFSKINIDVNNRLSIGIINPIWLGRFAGMAILIIYNFQYLRFRYIYYSINIIVILLSGSKGPFLGLLIVIILHYINNKRVVFTLFSLIIVFILLFEFIESDFQEYLISRFLYLNPNSTELFQEIEDDRISIIIKTTRSYFENIKFNSFFFGLGPNQSSFYYYNRVINERWYPHNIFLEIFFEYGFIALITFLFTLFKTQLWKNSMFNNLILFFFINSLFSGDLPLNWFLFLFIFLKLLGKYV